jgi:hypothetical protein
MQRKKLLILMFGIFAIGYVGLTFMLKWFGIYNVYVVSIIKFLCLIIIPILFLKWNALINTFRLPSIFLILLNVTILYVELISVGNTAEYIFMHGLVPIPILLFLVFTVMSHESFIYGSRVTIFASLMSIILIVRFNFYTALIFSNFTVDSNPNILIETFKIDHIYYIIMSIVIYLLNLLMLDAVYEEKIRNWK